MTGTTNWFDRGGDAYARYRPDYPPSLAHALAACAPDRRCAVDVGCGNGQLTVLLAEAFDEVVGLDPSADQIANATPHARVRYRVAPAETLDVADHSVSLITAAQAAHWFDLPRFYEEARRVAVPGAAIALVSYGVPRLETQLGERFDAFYADEIGPYWPPERRLVDTGYAGIDFPFEGRPAPAEEIRREWTVDAFLGYVSTWSATRRAREAGQIARLTDFADDLRRLWGEPTRSRTIVWPIAMRLGVIR